MSTTRNVISTLKKGATALAKGVATGATSGVFMAGEASAIDGMTESMGLGSIFSSHSDSPGHQDLFRSVACMLAGLMAVTPFATIYFFKKAGHVEASQPANTETTSLLRSPV